MLENVRVKEVYLDGKKDNTYINAKKKIGSKMYKRTKGEEHISIHREPGRQYIGHVTFANGTGPKIAAIIFEHLEKNNVNISQFVASNYSMAINIDWKNNAIHTI